MATYSGKMIYIDGVLVPEHNDFVRWSREYGYGEDEPVFLVLVSAAREAKVAEVLVFENGLCVARTSGKFMDGLPHEDELSDAGIMGGNPRDWRLARCG